MCSSIFDGPEGECNLRSTPSTDCCLMDCLTNLASGRNSHLKRTFVS